MNHCATYYPRSQHNFEWNTTCCLVNYCEPKELRKSVVLRKWHLNCARGLFSHSLLLFLQMTNCSDVVSLLLMQKLLNRKTSWRFSSWIASKSYFGQPEIADFIGPKGSNFTWRILCIFAHCVLVINNVLKLICHPMVQNWDHHTCFRTLYQNILHFQRLGFQGSSKNFGQIREYRKEVLGSKSQLICYIVVVLVWKTISSDGWSFSSAEQSMVENLTFQVCA